MQIGVVEVGMGGKLDATNILNNQAVSVINKIARDHQEFLGTSLEEIALHKAGILRPNVPYILNPYNDSTVLDTINKYAEEIGAGPRLQIDTLERREDIFSRKLWHEFAGRLQPFQRDNAILGVIAAQQAVSSLGLKFEDSKILAKLKWVSRQHHFGRQHIVAVEPIFGRPGRPVLVDGAHNPDAAIALRGLLKRPRKRLIEGKTRREAKVEEESKTEGEEIVKEESIHDRYEPTTYVIAMKEDKNALGFLRTLLRPGDKVVTTTFGPVDGMPWVKPMDSTTLLEIAKISEGRVTGLHIPKPGALRAVYAASLIAGPRGKIVVTGSLYFVGDFYRELRSSKTHRLWNDEERVQEREVYKQIKQEESERVQMVFGDLKKVLAKDDPESLAIRELEDLAASPNKSMTRFERIKATKTNYEKLPPWVRATLAGTGAPPSDEQDGSDSEQSDEPLLTMRGMKREERIIPYSPDKNVSRNPLRMGKYMAGTEESEPSFPIRDQVAKPEPEVRIRKQVVERNDGPHYSTKHLKTES